MKRDHFLNFLAIMGSLIISLLGVEAGVRVFADDGMQFDLEMWKYTRLAKNISPNTIWTANKISKTFFLPPFGQLRKPQNDFLYHRVDS